ncbi:MAG: polyprenyl synthetase family protein [Candidatus Omnitrophota bacterium]
MSEIRKYLRGQRIKVDSALNRYLPPKREPPRDVHSAMRHSVFGGGKRIRPILAIESCRTCGGKLSDVMSAACAIELAHSYSLVHDDLPSMDDDDLRRGKLTAHRKFGEAAAILAGDALLTLSFRILASGKDPRRGIRVAGELADAIGTRGMIRGQADDLRTRRGPIPFSRIEAINANKTAALIRASLRIGAIASGASTKKIDAMSDFGYAAGLLFQFTDDILDRERYIRDLGPKKTLLKAAAYRDEAERSLKIFGSKADRLRAMAEYILKRDR